MHTLFYRPMLFLSLVVHGLVLAIPGQPEPEVVSEPEPEEEIQVSMLPQTAEPPPEPVAAEPPPTPTPPPPAAAPPPSRPTAVPQPAPVSAAPPTNPAPAPEAEAEAEPAPTVEAAAPTPPAFDPQVPRQQFVSSFSERAIAGDITDVIGLPQPTMLEQPQLYFSSQTNDATPVEGIGSMRWINDKKPDQVYVSLQERYEGEFTFVEEPEGYGGGVLYQVKTMDGETFGYINLLLGTGGASTIMVLWDHNPNEPESAPAVTGAAG